MNIPSILALILLAAILLRVMYRNFFQYRQSGHTSFGEDGYERIDDDLLADIAWYHEEKIEAKPNPNAIDELTWADLDMDAVYTYLNRTQSVAGEEVLYSMLHEIDVSDDVLARRRTILDTYRTDASARDAVASLLKKIGKDHFHGLPAYLFRPRFKDPGKFLLYLGLGLLPIVSLILCLTVHPAFLFVFLAAFLANIIIHFTSAKVWQSEIKAISHLYTVVRCADQLSKQKIAALQPELDELRALLPPLRPLTLWGSIFLMKSVGYLDFITDYLKVLFQLNMVSLSLITRHLTGHTDEINRLYALVGELDALLAVASTRAADERFSHPILGEQPAIEFDGLSHPLVANAVPNSLIWENNLLITGSNASGKSTFTKAVAINAILAQTIHTVCAASLRMPRARVITSMAIKDNILRGDSYFIAEIKSLKRVLDCLRPDRITLCFIDEILRGTNTVERIAASHALLRYLAGQNARLMAATHDVELTVLLADVYENRHFREELTPKGMVFPYTLLEGPASTRNAIALLKQMEFPPAVVESAELLAGRFDAERSWGS